MIIFALQNRDQINSEHRIKILLDVSNCLPLSSTHFPSSALQRYLECTENLKELYEDREGTRKTELEAMSGPNEFSEFYSRLKNIKDFYRRHPNEISIPLSNEFEEFLKARDNPNEANLVDFTDEEGYGRFLDLNQCFDKYINLKGIEKIDYLTYLSLFDKLFEIPKDRKLNAEYIDYLQSLLDYLQDYTIRVKPLLPLPAVSLSKV